MNAEKSIRYIVDNALCAACGACCGVCPVKAVEMRWNAAGYLIAVVDSGKCNNCGLCCKVCPSVESNPVDIKDCDPFHGICLNAYIGHSTDAEIRQKSNSGGLVTSLLCYLLERGLVDGAIVNRFSTQTKRPEVVCASNREELLNAAGSYYCQSPVVKTILDHKNKKIAAVVLGCQAESLSLIRKACPDIAVPEYTIGLSCSGQNSGSMIDDLVSLAGADPAKIERLRFRDKDAGGWPGNCKIYTADQEYVLSNRYRHQLEPVYETYRCLQCFDQMNTHSDIVAGDPWGIVNEDNKRGNTVIITRTPKGQRLIDDAAAHGYISVSILPIADVICGQKVDTRLKARFYTALNACRNMGRLLPVNESDFVSVPHLTPNKKQYRINGERLRYALKTYTCENADQVAKIRARKKRSLSRKRLVKRLIVIIKSVFKSPL